MSPELLADLDVAALMLPKMLLVAVLVVTATIATERLGPVVGALIATLPVVSGPVLAFLAIDHGPDFISQVALSAMATTVPTAIFVAIYVVFAQRLNTVLSLLGAVVIWLGSAALTTWSDKTLPTAITTALMVLPLCVLTTLPYASAKTPKSKSAIRDMLLRGVAVAIFVAMIEILSLIGGPTLTGLLLAFPTVYLCMVAILQPRFGGPAAGAVMAHAIPGLGGISLGFLVVHLAAVPFGNVISLLLGLGTSVGWNLMLLTLHTIAQRRTTPAASPTSTT